MTNMGVQDNEMVDQAEALLERRDFDAVVTLLGNTDTPDPRGELAALLGLAHFHLEQYSDAVSHYATAVQKGAGHTDHADWQHMLGVCEANHAARVDEVVPPLHYFERDKLLAPPEQPSLPLPDQPTRPTASRRAHVLVGEAIGKVGTVVFNTLTDTVGRNYKSQVWTDWYRKRLYTGILTLAYMREQLNRTNLRSTYPPDANIGFQPPGMKPPPGVTHFRTADGSWNNLDNPKEGAAGTRFSRNVESSVIRPANDGDLLTPNPRLISQELLRRKEEDGAPVMSEVPFLNLLAASWIQFQNHDWITHGENPRTDVIEIPLPEGDPARRRYRQSKIFVARTQPDPTRQEQGEPTPVSFINEVTHWWDGSQIYGSDLETQGRLRSGIDGKLRVTEKGTLPMAGSVEETGMVRNWWVGLAMFHTLFVLEHNAICDHLKEHNPHWDDNKLFNVARLINAAVMAKVHSVEWTPAILPNEGLDLGLNANWYGILTYQFQPPENRQTVSAFNVDNPELGGIVGNPIEKNGDPFALSEEFVEVYRLHSLLPESLRLRRLESTAEPENVDFVASRQAGSAKITEDVGMANLFYSFGNQHPGQLALNNYPRFMQELSIPGNPVFDMAAVDIVRARERGIPRYNEFRRQLGLNPIRSFDDLTPDKDVVKRIKDVYGDDVESLDLMVGTLAEANENRPDGFGFGETMFQIFILNASRRLQADRFYTDSYTEEVYTAEGLAWVDKSSLKAVLLRHYPELGATGLGNVTNAFEPWDAGPLDPNRHPLRRFNKDLRKDPWKGDAN